MWRLGAHWGGWWTDRQYCHQHNTAWTIWLQAQVSLTSTSNLSKLHHARRSGCEALYPIDISRMLNKILHFIEIRRKGKLLRWVSWTTNKVKIAVTHLSEWCNQPIGAKFHQNWRHTRSILNQKQKILTSVQGKISSSSVPASVANAGAILAVNKGFEPSSNNVPLNWPAMMRMLNSVMQSFSNRLFFNCSIPRTDSS